MFTRYPPTAIIVYTTQNTINLISCYTKLYHSEIWSVSNHLTSVIHLLIISYTLSLQTGKNMIITVFFLVLALSALLSDAAPTLKPTFKPTVKVSAKPTVKGRYIPIHPIATDKIADLKNSICLLEVHYMTELILLLLLLSTQKPTTKPSNKPTLKPTLKPSGKPTSKPSVKPTPVPTSNPTSTYGKTWHEMKWHDIIPSSWAIQTLSSVNIISIRSKLHHKSQI